MGKRKNGEGTVRYRESDHRWEARVFVGYDSKGNPKTRNVTAKTKSECLDKLEKLKQEVGTVASCKICPEMKFGDWMNHWYQTYCKLGLKPSTRVTYEHRIYDQIIPKIGDVPLKSITASMLDRFYAELRYKGRLVKQDIYGEGLSMATIRNIYFHCKAALDRAVKDRLILSNPADACTPIPKRSAEVEVLSPEEMQRLMIQAKEEGFFEMFMLDIGTGLRRGELLGLQWSDINFETGEVKITRQINMVGKVPTVSTLKTKSSNRTIILQKPMLDMLREYKERVNSRWLFPSPVYDDKPRDPTACRKKLSQILEHAGCKHVKFHALRHTYATMSLAYGMDVKTLSATLGHASVSETLDIYSHTTDEMQKSAAAKIDKAFGNADEADLEEEEKEENKSYPRPDFEPYKGKKRRSGTGYVKQLSKNCWQGRYTPTVNGKRISKNVYGKTEEECKAKLEELIAEMNREREEGALGFDMSM